MDNIILVRSDNTSGIKGGGSDYSNSKLLLNSTDLLPIPSVGPIQSLKFINGFISKENGSSILGLLRAVGLFGFLNTSSAKIPRTGYIATHVLMRYDGTESSTDANKLVSSYVQVPESMSVTNKLLNNRDSALTNSYYAAGDLILTIGLTPEYNGVRYLGLNIVNYEPIRPSKPNKITAWDFNWKCYSPRLDEDGQAHDESIIELYTVTDSILGQIQADLQAIYNKFINASHYCEELIGFGLDSVIDTEASQEVVGTEETEIENDVILNDQYVYINSERVTISTYDRVDLVENKVSPGDQIQVICCLSNSRDDNFTCLTVEVPEEGYNDYHVEFHLRFNDVISYEGLVEVDQESIVLKIYSNFDPSSEELRIVPRIYSAKVLKTKSIES
jgi:hypothetical protein